MTEERKNYRPRRRPFHQKKYDNKNIPKIIAEIETKLKDSIVPTPLNGLNSFERKLVHRHFDHNDDYQTRTYRNGDKFTLFVYPVGNIKRLAAEKAQESLDTGSEVDLPPMGSFERFLVHSTLKDFTGIQTQSVGEGEDRHVQIVSKRFGRGLKRIVRKIKLF
ncbi:MAG: R3H domain-containing nucleic acid-binding protein [bacterium]